MGSGDWDDHDNPPLTGRGLAVLLLIAIGAATLVIYLAAPAFGLNW